MGNMSELDTKQNLRFRLFFLREGSERGVEVREVQGVDFQEIEKRLEQGEAIVIAPQSVKNLEISHVSYRGMRDFSKRRAEEPWYFTHE